MWKKSFRARGKENQHQIGNPVLVETSYNGHLLSKAKHMDLMQAAQAAQEAQKSLRPPQIEPLRPISNAPSSFYDEEPDPRYSQAASSVYSQPTPRIPYEHWPPTDAPPFAYQQYDVSPVEEGPNPYDSVSRSSTAAGDEPKSRFSWSTRATTAYQHSPPPSPPPALPTKYPVGLPSNPRDPTAPFDRLPYDRLPTIPSIRTVSSHSTATTRKPVPSPSPSGTVTSAKRSQTLPTSNVTTPTTSKPSTPTRSMTPTNPNKSLPLPPQLQDSDSITASDPISKYTAQLDDLALRRNNINRVIKDLTSLPDLNNPLAVDIVARRANERRVKVLEEELTEIGREEHDIGMKLHRARKRAERDEGNDGGTTALWVRRVTNPV